MCKTFIFIACLLILGEALVAAQSDPGGYLDGHNKRRKFYHEKFGKTYVPVLWSRELAKSSQEFADYLVSNNCRFDHCSTIFGYSKCQFGENLAMNWGGGPSSAENVLTRWTENEESYNGGHYTQVIWRATKYIGCGVASGSCGHIQVCRYIKPGNCNGSGNYLNDDTPCGPECPPEGCFTGPPAPTPEPTSDPSPPPGSSSSSSSMPCRRCKDDPDYLWKDRPKRGCDWVAKKTETRCKNAASVKACPKTCDACKLDDPDYLWKDRPKRGCDWVAKKTDRRCGNGGNVLGCPVTCGVCKPV